MRVVLVTGTNTGVGKTVVTAALAICAQANGERVAVVKPVQTGVEPGAPGDLAEIERLTGITDLHEFVRYTEPLAPATAARRVGGPGPSIEELAGRIAALGDRDVVFVEGAGGALVRFNAHDETLLDLADHLPGVKAEVVLVASSGLGVLNSAALTAAAITGHGLALRGVVIGDWPNEPDLADRCNLADLPSYVTTASLDGVVPSGVGVLERDQFVAQASMWLTPALGGTFDTRDFVARNAAPLPVQEGRS